MSGFRWGIIAGGLAALLLSAGAAADTVVLRSGAQVSGEVFVLREKVRVENENGILIMPLSRVRRIIRHGAGEGVAVGTRAEEHGLAAEGAPEAGQSVSQPPEGPDAARAAEKGRPNVALSGRGGRVPTRLLELLHRPISVDFRETPLIEAVRYIQEVTEANFAYDSSDLRADPVPVDLRLKEVPLHHLLDILLEGRGLRWGVVSDIIRIVRQTEAVRMEVRCYEVRDLQVNVIDISVSRRRRFGSYSLETDEGERAQYRRDEWDYEFEWDSGREWDSDRSARRGRFGRSRAGQSREASERTYNLACLITLAVRPGSWAEPAVIWAGGQPRRERREREWDYEERWRW